MNKEILLQKIVIGIIVLMIFAFSPLNVSTSDLNYGKEMNGYYKDKSSLYSEMLGLDNNDIDWVEETLSKMPLKEKCAQMIMPWALGNYLPEDSVEFNRLVKLVKDDKVGGIIFFKGNILNEALLIKKMQKLSDVPLLIASDFERGLAMRLTDAIEFPYNMALAAAGDVNLAYRMGKDVGYECRMLGVNQNYAPVADINNNPENPIINIRAYSEDKNQVAEYCDAFIKGLTSQRILATAKHFPGHGDTRVDSHQDMPVINCDSSSLTRNELVPFDSAIKSGVQSIMVGHLHVPALDSGKFIPATLSKPIITRLLKGKMKFNGLVATDAMNMSAVTKYFSAAEATVMAVNAGNDLILMPPDEDVALNSIYDAVKQGKISEDRIDESVRKILAAKRWLRLDKNRYPDIDRINKYINSKPHIRLAEEIAEKSITLVKNNGNIIPVDPEKIGRVASIALSDGTENNTDLLFQKLVEGNFATARTMVLNKKSRHRDYQKALRLARSADLIILPSYLRTKAYQGTVDMSDENKSFIDKVLKLKSPSILISFGNPYLLSVFPKAKTYLCAYGDPPVSQQAMFKAVAGEISIGGKLPVTIPNTKFKLGDGLTIRPASLDFTGSGEDSSYNFSKVDSLLKKLIKIKTYPGCVLLLGKGNRIIYNKAFGNFSYNDSSQKMNTDAVFDLSSVTGPLAAGASAMILAERGKLDLAEKVSYYLPGFGKNGKADITVGNLLLGNSGLKGKIALPYKKITWRILARTLGKLSADDAEIRHRVNDELNMLTLQAVIEKITGRSLDEFVYDNLFKPLKMNRTMYNPPKEIRYTCPPVISGGDNPVTVSGTASDKSARMMGGVSGSAGLYSTGKDLAVFLRMLLQNGFYGYKQIFNPSTVKNWTSDRGGTALGWRTNSDESEYIPGLSKDSFGYSAENGIFVWVDPKSDLFIIFLSNKINPTDSPEIRNFRRELASVVLNSAIN